MKFKKSRHFWEFLIFGLFFELFFDVNQKLRSESNFIYSPHYILFVTCKLYVSLTFIPYFHMKYFLCISGSHSGFFPAFECLLSFTWWWSDMDIEMLQKHWEQAEVVSTFFSSNLIIPIRYLISSRFYISWPLSYVNFQCLWHWRVNAL